MFIIVVPQEGGEGLHVRRAFAAHSGAILVVERGRLCGIFTERDAVYRVLAEDLEPHNTRLEQVMTPAPHTITSARHRFSPRRAGASS